MAEVTLGLIQMTCGDSAQVNLKKAVAHIATAAKKGAQIVCLQELFTAPYFCQQPRPSGALGYAESIPGNTTKTLSAAAKEHHIVLVAGSVFEKGDDGKFYNTAVIIDADGSVLVKYRKMHIPHDPRYYEQNYFEPGNLGYPIAETKYGKIAVLICYDQWFPEAARMMALNGAEIIFYPTAIGRFTDEEGWEGDWQKAWEDVQRGHAIANNVYVAPVNRVGVEGKLAFWGGSFVSDPFGKVIAHAAAKEEILLAKVDLSRVHRIREEWGFFRNRRPDSYDRLTK